MTNLSQIQVGGTTYDICDTTARDSISQINSKFPVFTTTPGTILWSGGGWYMADNQDAPLTYPVSSCMLGITIAFQVYTNNALQNYDARYFFVPKNHVIEHPGMGVDFILFTNTFDYIGAKYLFIWDTHIKGNTNNTSTGTTNGITRANNHWVMTKVIAT